MEIWLQTGINMVILAAVYILMALGFAFILNLLGIFNLAHGAVYMVAAYICYLLVTNANLSGWVALPVTIIIVAIVGVIVERLLFRPFKGDFDLTVMVCIFMSTVLATAFNLRMGTKQISIPSFLPGTTGFGSYLVQRDRIFVVVVSVVILAVVMLFVRYSKWGAQMQAITQNREGAALQGIRFSRIAASTCAVGFALAGLAGIFSGALYNLSPYMGDQNLVYVLMLVILAGVGSFKGIFIVGVILGVMYAGLPIVLPGVVVDATASVLVLLILLIRPQGFFGQKESVSGVGMPEPGSGEAVAGSHKLAKWQSYGILGLALAVLLILPVFISGGYWVHVMCMAFIYTVVSTSFRTITISGQFSIAHAAYFGVGAYVSTMACMWLGLSPWLTIIMGAIASLVVGIVLAFPFARLRTVYYAMGTLFLGVVIVNLFTVGGKWTGGTSGLSGIQPLFRGSKVYYYYILLAFVIISLAALHRFEYSRTGVTLKAVAQSHLVASSVGISESRYRMLAVAVGCLFAGLAGGLYAHYQMAIAPTSFGLSASLWIIMYVLVGGIKNFWGPSVGVVVLLIVPEFFRDLKGYLPFVSASILLIIAFTLGKQGLSGLPQIIGSWISGHRSKKEVRVDAP